MNYEKAYKDALKRAKTAIDIAADKDLVKGVATTIFPELRESEDERTRKEIIEFLRSQIEDGNSVGWDRWISWLEKQKINTEGDFGRGYDCGYEACLNSHGAEWFEKQKEQKPAEPSDEELERHQKELYDFKVFAAKQAKEHHISFVHDFEWNNFCAELLSYFNEKQKPELVQYPPITYTYPSDASMDEKLKRAIIALLNSDLIKVAGNKFTKQDLIDWVEKQKSVDYDAELKKCKDNPLYFYDKYVKIKLKPSEWGEEDEKHLNNILDAIDYWETTSGQGILLDTDINWLKSLHPQPKQEWSEEDEKWLKLCIGELQSFWKFKEDKLFCKKKGKEDWRDGLIAWLKSLRPQPQREWSEEDETMINHIIEALPKWANGLITILPSQAEEYVKRLKSLRPSWKPSKDEERLINTSISFLKDFADKGYENAVECIDWLKSKLKNGNSGK